MSEPRGWCAEHDKLITEAVGHFPADALIVKAVLETPGAVARVKGCWACVLGEEKLLDVLCESALLVAKADEYGGSFTTDSLVLTRGGKP